MKRHTVRHQLLLIGFVASAALSGSGCFLWGNDDDAPPMHETDVCEDIANRYVSQ